MEIGEILMIRQGGTMCRRGEFRRNASKSVRENTFLITVGMPFSRIAVWPLLVFAGYDKCGDVKCVSSFHCCLISAHIFDRASIWKKP
jgi:hypothetical protein